MLANLLGGNRAQLTQDDIRTIEQSVSEVRAIPARTTVVRAGEELKDSSFLIEGLMSRYVDDRRGMRQLVAVQVPGDFVDLHGYPLKRLDHDVGTLTDVRIAYIPHRALDDIIDRQPALGKKLWFLTLMDAALHRQWIFRLGRLNAAARVAHFFCETHARLAVIGMTNGANFRLPLTQPDIGDICGLTSVHVNRVLKQVRDGGLCTFRGGEVTIHDFPELTRMGEFDPHYLYLAPSGFRPST